MGYFVTGINFLNSEICITNWYHKSLVIAAEQVQYKNKYKYSQVKS